jgi:hypothetical protein
MTKGKLAVGFFAPLGRRCPRQRLGKRPVHACGNRIGRHFSIAAKPVRLN